MSVAAVVLVVMTIVLGCRKTPRAWERNAGSDSQRETAMHDDLFDIAMASLGQIEQHDSDEALNQILDRLNQWLQRQKPAGDWAVDPVAAPMIKGLADLLEQISPLQKEFQQPRNLLELKNLARQFAAIPPQLDAMRTRVDLKKVDELAARHERAIGSSLRKSSPSFPRYSPVKCATKRSRPASRN